MARITLQGNTYDLVVTETCTWDFATNEWVARMTVWDKGQILFAQERRSLNAQFAKDALLTDMRTLYGYSN